MTEALLLSEADRDELMRLEECMWCDETRFDTEFMERHLAPDFFEFGRSGRTYTRAQTLGVSPQSASAAIPLPDLKVRLLAPDVAQVTYSSAVTFGNDTEYGRRSSIWTRSNARWVMRFHQGTPYEPDCCASAGVA
jgi:hypothetical protein